MNRAGEKGGRGLTALTAGVFVLYAVVFSLGGIAFWIGFALAAAGMVGGALWFGRTGLQSVLGELGKARTWAVGVLGGVALYGIFWIGGVLTVLVLPGGADSIASIYRMGEDVPRALVVTALFIVVVGEEAFWRGLLQTRLERRLGPWKALLAMAALYSAAHLPTANIVLLGAAGVAGLFFGAMYLISRSLAAVMVAHLAFDLTAFVIFPFEFS